MKAVILAGGLGTRLSEETTLKPKPMVEIGGKPIIWHIMKIYSSHGINDFVVCLGYKGYLIKEYFTNYFYHQSDLTVDLAKNEITFHQKKAEPWKITLVDTGEQSNTGGRLRRVMDYIGDEKDFCFTYGDGVADINITELIKFHKDHKKLATLTSIQPPGRYGAIDFEGSTVTNFREKPKGDGGWINGGFFVLSKEIKKYLKDDETSWEQDSLIKIAKDRQLEAYFHKGFWQAMDTLREKNHLEQLWAMDEAPWKVWENNHK